MDQNKIKEIANKYRKIQYRVTNIVTVFIIIIGFIVVALGIFFAISTNYSRIIIGSIMIVAGILDLTLSFKLKKVAKVKIDSLKDQEAYLRYTKITGKK